MILCISLYVCVVLWSSVDHVDAGQIPAWLHLPTTRQSVSSSSLHFHTDHLFHHHVGHQDHQRNVHHLPGHGKRPSHCFTTHIPTLVSFVLCINERCPFQLQISWQMVASSQCVISIIKKRRLMLFGHLAIMNELAVAGRILTAVCQSDWKRPEGRPHTSWLATMKNNLSLSQPQRERCHRIGTGQNILEVIGSKWSYTLQWCELNNDDDYDDNNSFRCWEIPHSTVLFNILSDKMENSCKRRWLYLQWACK